MKQLKHSNVVELKCSFYSKGEKVRSCADARTAHQRNCQASVIHMRLLALPTAGGGLLEFGLGICARDDLPHHQALQQNQAPSPRPLCQGGCPFLHVHIPPCLGASPSRTSFICPPAPAPDPSPSESVCASVQVCGRLSLPVLIFPHMRVPSCCGESLARGARGSSTCTTWRSLAYVHGSTSFYCHAKESSDSERRVVTSDSERRVVTSDSEKK